MPPPQEEIDPNVFLSPNVFIVQSTSFTVQPESQRHKRLVIGYDIDGFLILQEHAPLDQGRVLNPPTYPPTPDEQGVAVKLVGSDCHVISPVIASVKEVGSSLAMR